MQTIRSQVRKTRKEKDEEFERKYPKHLFEGGKQVMVDDKLIRSIPASYFPIVIASVGSTFRDAAIGYSIFESRTELLSVLSPKANATYYVSKVTVPPEPERTELEKLLIEHLPDVEHATRDYAIEHMAKAGYNLAVSKLAEIVKGIDVQVAKGEEVTRESMRRAVASLLVPYPYADKEQEADTDEEDLDS